MKLRPVAAILIQAAAVQIAGAQISFWMNTNGPGTSYDVRSLAVDTAGVVYAGTWNDGSIWKTTNGGGTWSKCAAVANPDPVLWITVNSKNQLFASAYGTGIYRSTDGGASWVPKDSGLSGLTVRTSMVDTSGNIWVANELGLFKSTNDGDYWSRADSGHFYNVFLDSSAAIVTEDAVLLSRSTNQGVSWTTQPFSGYSFLGVHADGSYIASSPTSQIYRSTNHGASWTDLHSGVTWTGGSWTAAFDRRGDIFYSRSGFTDGILASVDTGKTWKVVNSGLPSTLVLPLLIHPEGYLYVGTGGNGVYRSRTVLDSSMVPSAYVRPGTLGFGNVKITIADTLPISILNRGLRDSLRVAQIASTNSRFTIRLQGTVIPPYDSVTGSIIYAPTLVRADTGTISISTNDPHSPTSRISVSGQGTPFTGISGGAQGQVPETVVLQQNYPNPFNPSAIIRYGLPSRSHVSLSVFNTLGQQVSTLVNEDQGAGYHEVRFDATGLASGVYIYRLRTGSSLVTMKSLLVK